MTFINLRPNYAKGKRKNETPMTFIGGFSALSIILKTFMLILT